MNIAKIKKNIDNLKKIKEIIEISKFDTLHKLQEVNKITNTFMKMAITSKNLVEYATGKYWAKSPLLKKTNTKKTLWIFTTVSSKTLATSYSKQENEILEKFNFEIDELIAIGEPAILFSKKANIKPVHIEENIDKALNEIPSSIAEISMSTSSPMVKFISHNSYSQNEPIIILPISELNIKLDDHPINKNAKFYPSLASSISYLSSLYAERLTQTLIRDSKYYYLKEKLIRHEGSLKSVDKKIEETTRDMNKLTRKIETEELILVSQIAKRGETNE